MDASFDVDPVALTVVLGLIIAFVVFAFARNGGQLPLLRHSGLHLVTSVLTPTPVKLVENDLFGWDSDEEGSSESDGEDVEAVEIKADVRVFADPNESAPTDIVARKVVLRVKPLGQAWICGFEQDPSARTWFERKSDNSLEVKSRSVLQGYVVASARLTIRMEAPKRSIGAAPLAAVYLEYLRGLSDDEVVEERTLAAAVESAPKKEEKPTEKGAKSAKERKAPPQAPPKKDVNQKKDARSQPDGAKAVSDSTKESPQEDAPPAYDTAASSPSAPPEDAAKEAGTDAAGSEGVEAEDGGGKTAVDEERVAVVDDEDMDEQVRKRIRALRKKLRQIWALEEKRREGEDLTYNQLLKVGRKNQVTKELNELLDS